MPGPDGTPGPVLNPNGPVIPSGMLPANRGAPQHMSYLPEDPRANPQPVPPQSQGPLQSATSDTPPANSMFDRFNTPLGPGHLGPFRNWLMNNRFTMSDMHNYDLFGHFLSGQGGDFLSQFMKPNHPDFGNQSNWWSAGQNPGA